MHPSLVVSGRGDELHSDGGQKSGTGQHQLSLQWALFGLPLQAACCEALGEIRGSKMNLPVPEPVSAFPLVDGGRRGEWGGLPLQPKRDIPAGLPSLGSTWWAHHASPRKQSVGPPEAMQSPRAHAQNQVPGSAGEAWAFWARPVSQGACVYVCMCACACTGESGVDGASCQSQG